MITLYTFGPAFGLPDPSPFVTKAEVLLKMAGLPYRMDTKGFRKAPKGKLPYIRDGEDIIADSTFIRLHLEKRYNIDFDEGLSPKERGLAWAVEKMCEDHLYWLLVYARLGRRRELQARPGQILRRGACSGPAFREMVHSSPGEAGAARAGRRPIFRKRKSHPGGPHVRVAFGDPRRPSLTSWEKGPAEPTQPSSPSSWARFALALTPACGPAPSRTQISRTTAPD